MRDALTKYGLKKLLIDPEFIDSSGDKRNLRKTFRAARRRQVRADKLRIRRERVVKKTLGLR